MKQEGKSTRGMGKRLVAALSALAMMLSMSPAVLAEEAGVPDTPTAQVQQTETPDGATPESADPLPDEEEMLLTEGDDAPTLLTLEDEAQTPVTYQSVQNEKLGGESMKAAGLTTIADTRSNVAEGVSYRKIITQGNHGQNIGILTEVDMTKHVKIKAAYGNYYTAGSTVESRKAASSSLAWNMMAPTAVAEQYASAADAEGTVVMATNGDYFNLATGEPLGYLIMEGNQIKVSNEPYFAILKDGTAAIRDAGSDCSDVAEAISGPFYLIKNGEITQSAKNENSPMPRNSVGIRADGSVVFYLNDGRQAPTSGGMGCNEVASVLKDAGCVTAIYLDGGGSASVSARVEGTEGLQIVNSPSDLHERDVSSSLLIVSTAESSGVFDHASIAPFDELYTPGSQIAFTATGVDSAGYPAQIPDGLTWTLAPDSAAMGSVDAASGVFTSNGQVGSVTVELKDGDKTVGSSTIMIAAPDQIYFNSEEISLGFEDTTDFGLVVRYQNRDIHIKDGDIIWSMTDEKMGTFDGNLFTSSDGESLNGDVTATSAFDSAVSGKIHVIVGMLPTIVWDFEDHVNEDGTTTPAEEYYNSILTHSNYNRGGKESFEIVSIDDEEPVRFGSHALKLNYDFTQCGAVTEGAVVGTSEGMEVPGTPTAIGVWVYAPEGVGIEYEGDGTQSGFWLRGYVKDGTGTLKPYDFTLEPKAVADDNGNWNGQQPGIYWEGWKYLEADLTNITPPYSIHSGNTFRLMYVAGTKMGTKTANSIYFDNLQFVYGTNVDDIDSPLVDSIKVNNTTELTDGIELTDGTMNLRAEFSDVQNKYTSGVDADTVRIYIDGVNTADNEHYQFSVNGNDGYAELYNLELADGEHSVTVSLRDGFGNETEETRRFTVNAGIASPTTVQVTPTDSIAPLGGTVDLEIRAAGETVAQSTTSILLDKMFPDYTVTFAPGYEGETKYAKMTNTLTVTANRKEGEEPQDNLIATVSFKVPSTLTASAEFHYTVKSGSFTTADTGFYGTYSAPEEKLPVDAAIAVRCDPILVGSGSNILKVVDREGSGVANASIYRASDASLIGTTDEQGNFATDIFSAKPAKTTVYASTEDGKISFQYNVIAYAPAGSFENAQGHVMFNVSTDGDSTGKKRITWLSDPLTGGKQYLRYRVQGANDWTTQTAKQSLTTYTKDDDYKAANVNEAVLSNLKAGTTYEYQVGSSGIWDENGTGTFTVSDASKFFVMGDMQADDITNVNNMMELIGQEDYAFGIQTGDAIDDVTGYDQVADATALFSAEKLNGVNMIHVLGNHEYYGDADAERAGALFALDETKNGGFYSVTYGDIYVAVINYTNTTKELEEGLKLAIADAKASNATWKILTLHQPPYYTNDVGGNGPINSLVPAAAEEAGFNVVFSGHDHSLARTNPLKGGEVDEENGIVYYIAGSSGEKSYSISSQNVFDYDKIFKVATTDYTATYIGVEADEEKMVLTMYDVTGPGEQKAVDTCTIYTEAGACAAKGHEFAETPVCDNGKLLCSNCGSLVDPLTLKDSYTGWATDKATGRKMFFMNGVAQTGEFPYGEEIYCFDENGVALDGEQTVDEVERVLDNGLVVGGYTGFIKKSDGSTYHYENGVMTTGWYQDGENWYFFVPATGKMETSKHCQPDADTAGRGIYFDFAEDGKLISTYPSQDGYYYWPGQDVYGNRILAYTNAWVHNGNDSDPDAWYATNSHAHYITDTNKPKEASVQLKVDGIVYTFRNKDGKLLRGAIVRENGKLYYYWAGKPVNNGWFELDGKTYYAYEDGHLATGSVVIDGEDKTFNRDGELITAGEILHGTVDEYGYLTIKLANVPSDLSNVTFAVWSGDTQENLRWLNAEKSACADGYLWKVREPLCEFEAKAPATFRIHAYGKLRGETKLLADTTFELTETVEHLYSDENDTTCNRCNYVRAVEPKPGESVPMYRLYNPNSGEHFYTRNQEERATLEEAGWNYEGVAWYAPVGSGNPVYRMYNPNAGDHHYTMSWQEVEDLREAGWNYEGVGWDSAEATEDSVLLYRLYNPNAIAGAHHYTASVEERDNLVELGWRFEGPAWYGTHE